MPLIPFLVASAGGIDLNDKFKREFNRYKQYLKIKRIRSYKGR